MDEQRTYCRGRYRVTTIPAELRMSHWINAPVVERIGDHTILLDLSEDLWDLCDVYEDGESLILILRKYPGRTNRIEIRILPEPDRFEIEGIVQTREGLMSALCALP